MEAPKLSKSNSKMKSKSQLRMSQPGLVREKSHLRYVNQRDDIYSLEPKDLSDQPNVVECISVSKVYSLVGREEKVHAINNITLTDDNEFKPIKKGEFIMVRGPSGGGKTSFLNILGTIDGATSGTIRLLGNVIDQKSDDKYLSKIRLEKIGFVFQTFNLLATMTAYENVELPMRLHGKMKAKDMRKRATDLLKRVGLQDRLEHLPSELSGGEQQRVAIARALSNAPEILLLDEPTGDLDSRSTVEVMNLLLSINNFGYNQFSPERVTMIMVTHNPDLECYADRVLYINDGQIVRQILNERQFALNWEDYVKFCHQNNQ